MQTRNPQLLQTAQTGVLSLANVWVSRGPGFFETRVSIFSHSWCDIIGAYSD